MDALTSFNPRETVQTEQARPDQVPNNAGGYVFTIDPMQQAVRFLILGTDGGTYYVGQQEHTGNNARSIIELAKSRGEELVQLIIDVSEGGRAPRQNPTLFALAACSASPDLATRQAAFAAIPRVCRTATHLFIFIGYVEKFRGWGAGLKQAIAEWYTAQPIQDVAYQAIKYRSREGWSHRDLLRLSHPKTDRPRRKALFDWICHPETAQSQDIPEIVEAFVEAQKTTDVGKWVQLIEQHKLPWEALPTAAHDKAEIWEALFPHMGLTAVLRNLGRFSKLGLIAPLGGTKTQEIINRLTNKEALARARIHPLSILVALTTYQEGHGYRGSSEWIPVPSIISALNEAFYLSFGNVEPAGKRTLLGLDVSGSMIMGHIANTRITPLLAEAAMAMVAMNTEPEVFPMAFSGGFVSLPLTKNQKLEDVSRLMSGLPFSSTDCSVPMTWALENRVPADTFIIYTDNETWSGSIHPFQALRKYRDKTGIDARLAVVGMTATGFSIADPTDRGMLDVVGFDTATPNIISAFSRGEI